MRYDKVKLSHRSHSQSHAVSSFAAERGRQAPRGPAADLTEGLIKHFPSLWRGSMLNVTKCVPALLVTLIVHPGFASEISESSLRAADAEQMRIIVEGDAKAQNTFMHENYIINAPANRVMRKADVVEMLAHGKMASERFERVIEGTAITGNIGIVMGREIVRPAAGSELGERFGNVDLERRFTNVFLFEDGAWHFLSRQASVVGSPCK